MSKKLEMTFDVAGGKTMSLSLAYPQESLTLTNVKAAAAKFIPVLVNNDGAKAQDLKEAKYIETTETPITD